MNPAVFIWDSFWKLQLYKLRSKKKLSGPGTKLPPLTYDSGVKAFASYRGPYAMIFFTFRNWKCVGSGLLHLVGVCSLVWPYPSTFYSAKFKLWGFLLIFRSRSRTTSSHSKGRQCKAIRRGWGTMVYKVKERFCRFAGCIQFSELLGTCDLSWI